MTPDKTTANDGHKMVLSLPEVEALCIKAARGAGYSWGMAEEAGYAARWLAARGLPGPDILQSHLAEFDNKAWASVVPLTGETWCSPSGTNLCPLATGSALADRATLAGHVYPKIEGTAYPILLLPFIDRIAKSQQVVLSVRWDRCVVNIGADGCEFVEGLEYVTQSPASSVKIAEVKVHPAADTFVMGCSINGQALRQLETLAMRTYVPATEQSRAGAGAASSDND